MHMCGTAATQMYSINFGSGTGLKNSYEMHKFTVVFALMTWAAGARCECIVSTELKNLPYRATQSCREREAMIPSIIIVAVAQQCDGHAFRRRCVWTV